MDDTVQKFLDALDNLINADGPWPEKANRIKDESSSSLDEFLSWFELDEDGEDRIAE